METYKEKEYDLRNSINTVLVLPYVFEDYVEETNRFIDILINETKDYNVLKSKNKNLEHNWKELRNIIEKTIVALHENAKDPTDEFITTSVGTFGRVLNMMDELEGITDEDDDS